MIRRCEICTAQDQHLSHAGGARQKLRRILVGERIIALCEGHFQAVGKTEIETVDELRARFSEARGKRALLPRRSPLDRRVFPPRPEGRRRSSGRRSGDPE